MRIRGKRPRVINRREARHVCLHIVAHYHGDTQPRLYTVWYDFGMSDLGKGAFGNTYIIDERCTPHCLTGSALLVEGNRKGALGEEGRTVH